MTTFTNIRASYVKRAGKGPPRRYFLVASSTGGDDGGAMRPLACAVLLVTCASVTHAARPKIAALILKTGAVDVDLADNLTEVLISRLARRGEYEIAGKEELKTRLGIDENAAAACMDSMGCLGRVGTELGVTRMVVGTLGRRGSDYLYNLSLIDIATGHVDNRVFEMVAGGKVESLIGAVQATAERLFQPKVEPGGVRVVSETAGALVYLDDAFIGSSPVRRDGVEPGAHWLRVEKENHLGWKKEIDVPAGSTLQIKVPLAELPERRRWPGQFATATLIVAGLAATVGIVLVSLATDAPSNSAVTRKEAIASADRRFVEGRVGIGLLAGAGALALNSAVLAIAYHRDVFSREAPRPISLGLGPARGGALVVGEVRW
jgi:hypothetical protein